MTKQIKRKAGGDCVDIDKSKNKELFFRLTNFMVGNGSKTPFWEAD